MLLLLRSSFSPAAATEQEVSITCDPGCDELKVDDKVVEPGKLSLAAGKHSISASKADFKPATESITVELGKKLDKVVKLSPEKKAPTTTTTPPATTTPPTKTLPKCTRFIKTNCQK